MIGSKRIGIYPHGEVQWYDRVSGSMRVVYQLTPQLPDQAAEYAYMSLGVSPSAVLGRGTFAGTFKPWVKPLEAVAVPRVAGIPTTAGQFVLQPLQTNEVI